MADNQANTSQQGQKAAPSPKGSQGAAARVGEEWPPLLSKKWLAIHFGCISGGRIARNRFRNQVLTPDVLERAGIPLERAYSVSTKTFNVIDSMNLTKVLRGFCLLCILAIFGPNAATAQTAAPITTKYLRDTTIRDTFPGLCMVTDSVVRMVNGSRTGEYRYENVLAPLVLDAVMVSEYKYLVRASDGGLDPFDKQNTFYLKKNWAVIDNRRILLFRELTPTPPPPPKK